MRLSEDRQVNDVPQTARRPDEQFQLLTRGNNGQPVYPVCSDAFNVTMRLDPLI